jgi:hypothetical protein
LVRRPILRGGVGRARPGISPVTAAFNIGEAATARSSSGRSSGTEKRSGFQAMAE